MIKAYHIKFFGEQKKVKLGVKIYETNYLENRKKKIS